MSPAPEDRVAGDGSPEPPPGRKNAAEHPKMRHELFNLYKAGSTGIDTDRYGCRHQEMSQAIGL